jgi:hypothetical protein
VGVDLGEELLEERDSKVEALESVELVDEVFELLEADLVHVFRCLFKGLLEGGVLLRDDESDLLDGRKLPVKGACIVNATSEGLHEVFRRLPSGFVRVWILVIHQPLDVLQLHASDLVEIHQSQQPVQFGRNHLFWLNHQDCQQRVLQVLLRDDSIEVSVEALEGFFSGNVFLGDPVPELL